MLSTAEPALIEDPDPTNPYWFGRGCVLGAAAGAVIALGLLIALRAVNHDWVVLPPAAILGLPIGAMAGGSDAMLAGAAVALMGRRARALVWPVAVVAGLVASAIPLIVTFHAGYPTADGGIWIGLGLSGAAFLSGAALTPVALWRRGR